MKLIKVITSMLLVVMMTLVPTVSVLAAGPIGAYDNPYKLTNSQKTVTATVAAESDAYATVEQDNNSTVKIESSETFIVMYCRQPYYPTLVSGKYVYTLTTVTGAPSFSLYNSAEAAISVKLTYTPGTPIDLTGTIDQPHELTLAKDFFGNISATGEKALEAGTDPYYWSVVATQDGKMSVSVNVIDSEFNFIDWQYCVNVERADGTFYYGDIHTSCDEEVVYYENVDVKKNDKVVVWTAPYDPSNLFEYPAGTVVVEFALSPVGSFNNPDSNIALGTHSTTVSDDGTGYYYQWVVNKAGTFKVAMGDASGWTYNVQIDRGDGNFYYGDTHWYDDDPVVSEESVAVNVGDVVTIHINTYDSASGTSKAGTVNWSMSVTTEGGDIIDDTTDTQPEDTTGEETEETNYEESTVALELGTKEYPLSTAKDYTVFTFTPAEIGKYTIITTDSVIGSASYNGNWVTYTLDETTVADTSVVWECTSVGQSTLIAVKGADTASITIAKEDIVIVTIPWDIYKNKAEITEFVFEGNVEELVYVETFDDEVNQAVLGADGFYHLDSANGPILYVDLDDVVGGLDLYEAMTYGQLREVIYLENGEVDQKIDYNEAFGQYYAAADADTKLYPLTDDLITIYTRMGEANNWYGEDGWIGGNEADAWMYACYYIDGESFENNDVDTGDTGNAGQDTDSNADNDTTATDTTVSDSNATDTTASDSNATDTTASDTTAVGGTTANSPASNGGNNAGTTATQQQSNPNADVASPPTSDSGIFIVVAMLIASVAIAVIVGKKVRA